MRENTKLMKPVRSVMIVDDHPLYSDALSATIVALTNVKRVEIAQTLREAEQLLSNRFQPTVVFLDLNLPDATGMVGFLSLIKRLPDTPVIIISATTNPEMIIMAKNSGAAGYIPKNLPREKLEGAIASLLDGRTYFPAEYTHVESSSLNTQGQARLQDISEKLSQLTRQQSRILEMICEGMLNKQIAYELNLSEATVKTHITAMMRKLGVQNRTQAALLVRDVKLVSNLE